MRAVAPFLAGSSGMPLRRFVPYDVIGAGLWGSTFVLLGYIFWQSFSQLVDYAKKGALALGAVIVLVAAIVWLVRWVRDEDNRAAAREWIERQAERPALRPLVAVLAPVVRTTRRPARFVWDRVTPGDLGLELTTLLAVAAVGAFVFVWDLVRVEQQRPARATRRAAAGRPAARRRAGRRGQGGDGAGLAAGGDRARGARGAALAWRHELREAVALVVGLALTYAAVHITKDAVDRPRPARALVDVDGAATRPGHAAYAVTWVAVAVAISRALPGVASRFAFVTVAIVIAAAVGLTPIYLRVALPLRRRRRMGAGRRDLRAVRHRGAGHRLRAEQCRAPTPDPMSNESIIYLVAACSGVFGLAAYVGLIVVPAWTAYSRVWERLAATFLTLYVLAGFLILGVVGGAAVIWFWDRITALIAGPLGLDRLQHGFA